MNCFNKKRQHGESNDEYLTQRLDQQRHKKMLTERIRRSCVRNEVEGVSALTHGCNMVNCTQLQSTMNCCVLTLQRLGFIGPASPQRINEEFIGASMIETIQYAQYLIDYMTKVLLQQSMPMPADDNQAQVNDNCILPMDILHQILEDSEFIIKESMNV